MAPPATGGRSIHVNTTGTGIYRALDRTYGEDEPPYVSFPWISTDTAATENLQVVDFNTASGGFGLVVGQVRGLAADNAADGMYELAYHPAGVSADIAPRDQASHFVLLRFTFGPSNVDTVEAWWDPESATFSESSPSATVENVDATFDRITLRSGPGADSLDELCLGATVQAVTEPSLRITTYHVGNSLTWDAQPDGIEALSGQCGYLHDTGYHIRCGQTLENIWSVPNDTCVAPVGQYGTFQAALPSHAWSAVTLQPHRGGTSTLLSDETVIGHDRLDAAEPGQHGHAVLHLRGMAGPHELRGGLDSGGPGRGW